MLTRRRFLGSTAAAGAALSTGARPAPAQNQRKRMIVDSQIHLWKADAADYRWRPEAKPQLPEPFTIERALPLMDAAGIDRAVVVPPTLNDVNIHGLEAARRHPDRFKVMGRIPIENSKNAELLPKWREQPGMLGIRLTFNDPRYIAMFDQGVADWFWPAAEKAQIPVMFMAAGRLPAFPKIAERHPGLTLIIDHMGLTSVLAKEGKTAETIGHAIALAKYPNVSIKMSNIPSGSQEPYPFRNLHDHIKRVFDAYGPQRCHWGTDITNNLAQSDWKQRLAHVTEELKFMSEEDKDWVLGRSILQRLRWT